MVELVHHLAVRDCSSVNHVIYSLFERRYFARAQRRIQRSTHAVPISQFDLS